jgi:hypothetical protein
MCRQWADCCFAMIHMSLMGWLQTHTYVHTRTYKRTYTHTHTHIYIGSRPTAVSQCLHTWLSRWLLLV